MSGINSLLGESEGENVGSFENEGEQFFGKAFKKIGGFIKKAAPILTRHWRHWSIGVGIR